MAPCISVSEILLLLLAVSVFARVCVCVGRGGEGAKDPHSEFTPLLKFKN